MNPWSSLFSSGPRPGTPAINQPNKTINQLMPWISRLICLRISIARCGLSLRITWYQECPWIPQNHWNQFGLGLGSVRLNGRQFQKDWYTHFPRTNRILDFNIYNSHFFIKWIHDRLCFFENVSVINKGGGRRYLVTLLEVPKMIQTVLEHVRKTKWAVWE